MIFVDTSSVPRIMLLDSAILQHAALLQPLIKLVISTVSVLRQPNTDRHGRLARLELKPRVVSQTQLVLATLILYNALIVPRHIAMSELLLDSVWKQCGATRQVMLAA